jgi:hypothetical protein
MSNKARLIAFYLPQYHPIPENDEWWGKGFTEWTNVAKAKPHFWKHDQPKIPTELGFYDLRLPETRIAQANLAKEAGIEGFCYWHYWLGNGKRLLEEPFNEVLKSGNPNFPFCLGWANHSWENKTWTPGKDNKLLIEQTYNGIEDYTEHFNAMLPAFKDKRYLRVNNKPLFVIWAPDKIPDSSSFIKLWNNLAIKNGFDGFHFVAYSKDPVKSKEFHSNGYNAVAQDLMEECSKNRTIQKKMIFRILKTLFSIPRIVSYDSYTEYFIRNFKLEKNVLPVILPNYDHSPRSGTRGLILHKSTPDKFKIFLNRLSGIIKSKQKEENIVFIKAWNEWGEGNFLEPDLKFGRGYIDAIKESNI